jgi:hypothetical protein
VVTFTNFREKKINLCENYAESRAFDGTKTTVFLESFLKFNTVLRLGMHRIPVLFLPNIRPDGCPDNPNAGCWIMDIQPDIR